MKKSCFVVLMVVLAFTCTAIAQSSSQASGTSSQKSGKSSTSKSSDMSGMKMDNSKGSGEKTSTLTGCISSSANSEGMYTLSNGRYKKGVEVGPADKVKDHAGHQVALTGKWGTGKEAGEKEEEKGEKGERHFVVESVKHISPTCSEAPGGGTTGTKGSKGGKSKTSDASSTPKGL